MNNIRVLALAFVVCGSTAVGQAGPIYRLRPDSNPATLMTAVATAADLDGDGDADLVVPSPIGVYLNGGDGQFRAVTQSSSSPISGSGTRPPVAIDLTGDSLLDLVIASDQGWQLLPNLGGGQLAAAISLPLAPFSAVATSPTVVFDVDGDSDEDILVFPSQTLPTAFAFSIPPQLYRQQSGQLSLATVTLPTLATWLIEQAISADLDRDGDSDLVLAGRGSTQLALWLNDGSGNFVAAALPIVPLPTNRSRVAVGDINQDTWPDIIIASQVAYATGIPPLAPPAGYPIHTLFGSSIGFAAAPSVAIPFAGGIEILDLGPGFGNHLGVIGPRSIDVYRWTPGGFQFPPAHSVLNVGNTPPVLRGDLDGDGDLDLLVKSASEWRSVMAGERGQITVIGSSPESLTTLAITSADLNGDSAADVIYTSFPGWSPSISIATNDRYGNFSYGAPITCPPTCGSASSYTDQIVAFDAEPDGDLDLYATNLFPSANSGGADYLLLNSGTSVWATQQLPVAERAAKVVPTDVDGDGDLDLVRIPQLLVGPGIYPSPVRLYLNVGGPVPFSIVNTFSFPVATQAHDLIAADLDGDGDPDFAVANRELVPPYLDQITLFWNNAPTGINVGPQLPVSADSIEAGDIDGDSDIDLLCGNVLFTNAGNGVFTSSVIFAPNLTPVGGEWRLVDVDVDGDLDVVDVDNRLYLQTAPGLFASGIPASNLGLRYSIRSVADFDSDGDPDLLIEGPRVLWNHTRHLRLDRQAALGRSARIALSGPPSANAALALSLGPPSPLSTSWGVFGLELSTFLLLSTAPLDATGEFSFSVSVPNQPALLGLPFLWQGAVDTPFGPRLTNLLITTALDL